MDRGNNGLCCVGVQHAMKVIGCTHHVTQVFGSALSVCAVHLVPGLGIRIVSHRQPSSSVERILARLS